MTTIALDYSDRAVEVLQAAALQFTVNDPGAALNAEREYGRKLKPGSVKHAAHLERMKELTCQSISRQTHTSKTIRCEPMLKSLETANTSGSDTSKISPSSPLTSDQCDAVKMLVTLNGATEAQAIKAVQRVDETSGAAHIWQQAVRYL